MISLYILFLKKMLINSKFDIHTHICLVYVQLSYLDCSLLEKHVKQKIGTEKLIWKNWNNSSSIPFSIMLTDYVEKRAFLRS